jgi:hypothetical protein
MSTATLQAPPVNSERIPDPTDDLDDPFAGQKYLKAKGWKALGSMRDRRTLWRDPLGTQVEKYEKVPVLAPHVAGKEMRIGPVMVKDANNSPVPCEQTRVTPVSREYSLNDALRLQLDRDEAAEKAKANAESKKVA